MAEAKTELRIFFSWQSDLPNETTTGAIRETLIQACNDIEAKHPEVKLFVEESTTNMPGSPDIPNNIFEKIQLADIFIADITTINSHAAAEQRRVANPNVSIELGYALCELGWERVIILFNKNIGSFPDDVAFDIDNRRIGQFAVSDKKDKQGKNLLKDLLFDAIEIIIKQKPLKPYQKRKQKPDEIKRTLDIINLKRILSTINIDMLDNHIQIAPKQVNTKIIHYYESFKGVLLSSSFSLYDKKAYDLLNVLYEYWSESLAGDYYHETRNPYIQVFGDGSGKPMNHHEKMKFAAIRESIVRLYSAVRELLNYIRENYLEINIEEMSKAAYEEYLSFHQED
jgi:hypothetical protein